MYAWHNQIHHNFVALIYLGWDLLNGPIQSLTLPSPASVQLAINSFILILKVAHSSWTLLSHRQRGIGLSQRAPGRFLGGNSSGAGSRPLLDASPPRSRGFMVREWVWSVML